MLAISVVSAVVCVAALVVSLPALRTLAIDLPNHRSSHVVPIPRGGGVAVAVGLSAGCLLGYFTESAVQSALIFGILSMAALGLLDDLRSQHALVRLVLTLLIGVLVSAALIAPEKPSSWPLVGIAGVVLAGYVNAFNFMDGINGISAFSAALSGAWLAMLGWQESNDGVVVLGLALLGSSLGFLPFNFPRARVFLGDSGSYALGFAISGLGVWAWQSGAPLLLSMAPLWIYVVDTFVTFSRRVIAGRRWAEPHRDHVYQRLVDAGASHGLSASLVALFTSLACGMAWLTRHSVVTTTAVEMVVGALYLALPGLWTLRQRRKTRLDAGGVL